MLKAGFERHLDQTHGHIERVEKVFKMHGVEASAVNCPAIDGIIEETDEISDEIEDDAVLDAALIAAAQAVEHYEITRYGIAHRLGQDARTRGLRCRARPRTSPRKRRPTRN